MTKFSDKQSLKFIWPFSKPKVTNEEKDETLFEKVEFRGIDVKGFKTLRKIEHLLLVIDSGNEIHE